jgi:hypothetical protein
MFVELALGLPLPASATSLFFDTINNPVGLFVCIVSFHSFAVFPITLQPLLAVAFSTPRVQSVS